MSIVHIHDRLVLFISCIYLTMATVSPPLLLAVLNGHCVPSTPTGCCRH